MLSFLHFKKAWFQFCLGWKTSTIYLTSHQVHVDHDLLHILFELHLDLHSQEKCHQQIIGLRKESYHRYHLCKLEITEDQEQTLRGPQQTHMRTMNLCLLLFGVYNIDNFQTILVNSLLFHNNSFCASNFCAKLYRKPLRNHKKTKQHSSFFSREFKIVLYSSINWCTEECLGKKPDWYW